MPSTIRARLNAKVQPIDRGEVFEDPLNDVLQKAGLGEVTGGGTQLGPGGEIAFVDIEISLSGEPADKTLRIVIGALERLGIPKGSRLLVTEGHEIPFGTLEGLGLYLNGADLPSEVYETSDVNHLYEEINRLLDMDGQIQSYWEGASETALYMYGAEAESMRSRISELIAGHPLCQKSRLVKIA